MGSQKRKRLEHEERFKQEKDKLKLEEESVKVKQICGSQCLSRRLPMIYILMISWSISWVRYTR
jgi:hypothetical protein